MAKVSYIQLLWLEAIVVQFKVSFLLVENLWAVYLLQDFVCLIGLSRNTKGKRFLFYRTEYFRVVKFGPNDTNKVERAINLNMSFVNLNSADLCSSFASFYNQV